MTAAQEAALAALPQAADHIRAPFLSAASSRGLVAGHGTAALITSLVLDHYGWFHMPVHAINLWRILGALLMVGGVTLIAKY